MTVLYESPWRKQLELGEQTLTMLEKAGIVVLCGSEKDMPHANQIADAARNLGLGVAIRIASAHRTPAKALQIVHDVDELARRMPVVLVTVAGRSNALSGFCDPQNIVPVIACPPPSDFANDVWSSLRMPSGVAPLYVCDPINAAVAAAKIIGLSTPEVAKAVAKFQEDARKKIEDADSSVCVGGKRGR